MSTATMTHHANGYWGVCPECHQNDGCINIGASHWFYCKEHKKMWRIGANIFSGWRDQTEDQQRNIHDSLGFGEFQTLTVHETHCRDCANVAIGDTA